MAIRIGSNISSIQAQRRLSETSSALAKTYERLSSGQRINRASDDAAGLSVASTLNTGKRVFTQGVKNINDGISLLQIGDSAVGNLSTIVTRIRELAEQSANGTFSSRQRKAIEDEAKELEKEYLRISREVSFNGMHLFDGSLTDGIRVQAGFGVDGSVQGSLGRGLGSGTFGSSIGFATETGSTGGLSYAVTLGDLNGDGILDMVTAGFSDEGGYQGEASVLLGRGAGTFDSKVAYATDLGDWGTSCAVALGDLNGDGMLDLVTAGYSYDGSYQGQTSVLLGRGDGSFGSRVTYSTNTANGGGISTAVALGDLNGDGILDLVTAGIIHDANYEGQASVFLGRGDGTFGPRLTYATQVGSTTGSTNSVALGDVDGDGILDLVTAGAIDGESQASVLLGRGDGTFGFRLTCSIGGSSLAAASLGDVNGDGILDLVTVGRAGGQGQANVLLGQGDGTFGSKVSYATDTGLFWGSSRALTLGDINGDGVLDMVTAGYVDNGTFQGQTSVLLGGGNGTFGSKVTYAAETGSSEGRSYAVATGDVDGDGILDLVTSGRADGQGQAGVLTAVAREGISPLLPFSLSTRADALQAMAPLDRKLSQLAAQRGIIGAFQSRLGAAIDTLQSTTENYAAAESRIRDADIAADAADLTRLQICQKAATAVLAQANHQPALAIQLLRNG